MVFVKVVFVWRRMLIVSVDSLGIRGVMAVDINLTEVLVSLIGAVASYFVGKRVGRSVHRSGDYRFGNPRARSENEPKDLLK